MRKKGFAALLLALCLTLSAFVPVFAEEGVDPSRKVYDYAGLFSGEEETALQSRADKIIEDCNLDMVFLTTESTDGMEARRYAADFYERNGFGLGADYSGIIMIVDMGERDAQIVTCGQAITIFTDYYIDRIWNAMRGSLSDGDFYAAMETLCDNVTYYSAEYIKYQENPEYVSGYQMSQEKSGAAMLFAGAGIFAAVVAGIAVAFMRKGQKNVKPYTDGRAYLKEDGVTITTDQNIFASTHTVRTPIPKENNNNHHSGGSWGGGSSTFHSGGGRSFGGSGGRF